MDFVHQWQLKIQNFFEESEQGECNELEMNATIESNDKVFLIIYYH